MAKRAKRANEEVKFYSVMRVGKTEVDYIVDVYEVESIKATWTEFMKYVRKNYELGYTRRRDGMVFVK